MARRVCARCGLAANTVVIGVSAVLAYLDLCEAHLDELLRGARPLGPETGFPGARQAGGAQRGRRALRGTDPTPRANG